MRIEKSIVSIICGFVAEAGMMTFAARQYEEMIRLSVIDILAE